MNEQKKQGSQNSDGEKRYSEPSFGEVMGIITVFTILVLMVVRSIAYIDSLEKFITVSPFLLTFFTVMLLFYCLRNYDLSKALSENYPEKGSPKRSSSRLIAFFTSLAAIIIAVCVSSAYLYRILIENNTSELNLDQFSKFLASLGIGIIPYITNKIKG